MRKVALVLSGGGALGAFEAAAAKYAHDQKGYDWRLIRGVSAGALNAGMIAQKKYTELETLWLNLKKSDVYKGSIAWGLIWRVLICGKRSIYDSTPLWHTIERVMDPSAIVTQDVEVGVTALSTGDFKTFGPGPSFQRAVYGSASLPVLWEPVEGLPDADTAVDGGVRHISPMLSAILADPDEIVVINCEPRDKPAVPQGTPRDLVHVATRTLSIAMHEILRTDVDRCLTINSLVKQAQAQNAVLTDPSGRPYKYYDVTLIEPTDVLGDPLDFSRANIDNAWNEGLARAKAVLG